MNWREMVQCCFVDMNELEQAAVEKWLAHNSLDTLFEREMPESGDTVVPTQPVPRGRRRGRRVHRHKHAAQQPHHLALRVPRRCGPVARPHRHRRTRTARQQTQQQPQQVQQQQQHSQPLCSTAPATSTQL